VIASKIIKYQTYIALTGKTVDILNIVFFIYKVQPGSSVNQKGHSKSGSALVVKQNRASIRGPA